jgi:hypothetical protein
MKMLEPKGERHTLNSDKKSLQTTLDKVHVLLTRPLGIGPDLTKSLPDVPVDC